ncbi:MAG TPA: DUF4350 domain-containing protein [Janthinobacterium sp.]|nr:DUF4350 domain-containing protein [Janthinobacterium sp.]
MSARPRAVPLLAGLLCLLLAAGAAWAWLTFMERRLEAVPFVSPAARANDMLAAQRLLERYGHPVRLDATLGETLSRALPDGTLILADLNGQMSARQAEQLLAWVRRGNVLLTIPRWSPEGKRDRPEAAQPLPQAQLDPIGARTGVALSFRSKIRDDCDADADAAAAAPGAAPGAADGKNLHYLACLTLPGAAAPLALETRMSVLQDTVQAGGRAVAPLWSDREGVAVRAYAEGAGRIVLMSANFFENGVLRQQDHAELLLKLAALAPAARQVLIVQRLDALRWYRALWLAWGLPLSGLGIFLLLLFWRAVRRFGPLLPEPAQARRALLQHIEASGNWLWRAPGGRELLLAATRRWTAALLQRRMPEWPLLAPEEQLRRLLRLTPFSADELRSALQAPAAAQAPVFTRQIQILQQLRQVHERHQRQQG